MRNSPPGSPTAPDARPALAWLRLLVEWGADEALAESAIDRRLSGPAARSVPPPPGPIPTALPAPALGTPAQRAEAAAASCHDLDALQRAMEGFDDFGLRQAASHTVRVSLGTRARLIVVGETAHEDEDRSGEPFAGRAGTGLDRMLGAIGLSRDDCALMAGIAWRPPGGRPPAGVELATCTPFLRRRLVLAARQIVARGGPVAAGHGTGGTDAVRVPALLLGKLPLRLLLADADVASGPRGAARRLDIDAGDGVTVDATALTHPSMLAAQPRLRRPAWHGLLALRARLDSAPDGPITNL